MRRRYRLMASPMLAAAFLFCLALVHIKNLNILETKHFVKLWREAARFMASWTISRHTQHDGREFFSGRRQPLSILQEVIYFWLIICDGC